MVKNMAMQGERDKMIDSCDQLEKKYRMALAAFKADKTNKDLRRARSAAKKAWDESVAANTEGEPLTCRDCSQMFIFNVKDQKLYADQGWDHRPTRCFFCSGMFKARRSDRSKKDDRQGKNMCYAFQKGNCPYGDECKFSHDSKFAGKDESEIDVAEKRETSHIALCKLAEICELKKCRFSPAASSSTTSAKAQEPNESTLPHPRMEAVAEKETTKIMKDSASKRTEKGNGRKEKIVVKAIRKALKKSPGKELKMKELRKFVESKIRCKNEEMSKDELKSCIFKAIVDKNNLLLNGKIVKLL
eukprot:758075_1